MILKVIMLDKAKYPEEQEDEMDAFLKEHGYSDEQLSQLYPGEKEAAILEIQE